MMKITHKFKNYLILFLGVVMLLTFIWLKFIRTRLPRDIPLTLTMIKLILLLNTCGILIYTVYSIIIKKNNTNFIIIEYLFHPLEILHSSTKSCINYRSFIEYTFIFIGKHIYSLFISEIIIRSIIICIFLYDVFLCNNLQYIYYAIYLYIYIYLLKYYLYVLKDQIKENANFVDERVTVRIYNILEPILPPEYCIKEQTKNLLIFKKAAQFILIPKYAFMSAEIDAGRKPNMKIIVPELNNLLIHSVNLNKIIMLYYSYGSKFEYAQLTTLILYFIGWLYILIFSIYHTPTENWLSIVKTLHYILEYFYNEIANLFA